MSVQLPCTCTVFHKSVLQEGRQSAKLTQLFQELNRWIVVLVGLVVIQQAVETVHQHPSCSSDLYMLQYQGLTSIQ
jgi:hypothetical protein